VNFSTSLTLRSKNNFNMNIRYYLFLSILVFILAIGSVQAVHAQSAGIRVQPSFIDERVDPGSTLSFTLRATNESADAERYVVFVRDIRNVDSRGTPIFAEAGEETGYEVSSWIRISTDPIEIASGGSVDIPFDIVVPQDASPGGHFGAVFLLREAERPEAMGAGVGFQVGMIVSIRVSGDVVEEARILEFLTDKNLYGKPSVQFSALIDNPGNVLVRPRGPLEIVDMFGKQIASLVMNESGAAVFPKNSRKFETHWEGDGIAFGRYQAILSLVYGEDGRKTITSTISFWVLPFGIILSVLGGLLGIILLIVVITRLSVRRKMKSLQHSTASISPGISARGALDPNMVLPKAPVSRLTVITLVLLVFTILFFAALFFFLA